MYLDIRVSWQYAITRRFRRILLARQKAFESLGDANLEYNCARFEEYQKSTEEFVFGSVVALGLAELGLPSLTPHTSGRNSKPRRSEGDRVTLDSIF